MSDVSNSRTAVIRRRVTATEPITGARLSLAPGVYLVAPVGGAAGRGELYLHHPTGASTLVRIDPHEPAVRIATGTEPFVTTPIDGITDPTGHRPGMVVGECGHAVAGSEWLAGYRVCERCAAAYTV